MDTQIKMLLASTILAALHFVPYFLAYVKYWGINGIVGNRENLSNLPLWAVRARSAHQNMNENYPHFAALVLIASYLEIATTMTATGAVIFFWSRVFYLPVYILGIPWIRSLLYTSGLVGEGSYCICDSA